VAWVQKKHLVEEVYHAATDGKHKATLHPLIADLCYIIIIIIIKCIIIIIIIIIITFILFPTSWAYCTILLNCSS
jgi:hypothetical protein